MSADPAENQQFRVADDNELRSAMTAAIDDTG
jgi:hypothetical protein